jgi:hypothetical protein
VAIVNESRTVNSAETEIVSDYRTPEIEQLADHSHVKRIPREPEPPEAAARACEEPESRQTGRWEAPDAGFDEFAPYDHGPTHGRSWG